MEGRCIVFTREGSIQIERCYIPSPGPNEVIVESQLSCISPGTELRVWAGKEPALAPGMYPLIPGYALLGRVTAWGAAVPREWHGARVVCGGTARSNFRSGWGGHASHAVVAAEKLIAVPDAMDPADAVLCPLAAIASRGLALAAPRAGETVAVLGLGLLGQLAARLYAQAGATVVAGGIHPRQVDGAARAGIQAVLVTPDSVARLQKLLPDGARIVVDATGNAAALPLAIQLAADKPWSDGTPGGARLIVQGSYAEDFSFPAAAAFAKEITVHWPRFAHRDDVVRVVAAVATGQVRFGDLLTAVVPPDAAEATYHRLRASPRDLITAAFSWQGASTAPALAAPPSSGPRGIFGRWFGKK